MFCGVPEQSGVGIIADKEIDKKNDCIVFTKKEQNDGQIKPATNN